MTLDEAIMLLQQEVDNPGSVFYNDLCKAQKLGIAALQLIAAMGECPYCHVPFHLPGETEK